VKILIQGHLSCAALLSQLHQRLVQSDANQPSRELGILSEFRQFLVGLEEGLLNRVLRIFSVMRDALSDSEKLAIVFLYELLESGNIAVLASVDKIQVIASHCPDFELG
jgi:hypothetical protein